MSPETTLAMLDAAEASLAAAVAAIRAARHAVTPPAPAAPPRVQVCSACGGTLVKFHDGAVTICADCNTEQAKE